MTSKEVQKMIILHEKELEKFGAMNTINFILDILYSYKQDLERLEKLEIENRNNEKVIKDSVALMNKNLELQQRLETLEKEKKEWKEYSFLLELSKQHEESKNEKLNKAIKLLKYLFDMDLELCSMTDEESIYLLSGDCYLKISSKAVDVDLLKEVLGK